MHADCFPFLLSSYQPHCPTGSSGAKSEVPFTVNHLLVAPCPFKLLPTLTLDCAATMPGVYGGMGSSIMELGVMLDVGGGGGSGAIAAAVDDRSGFSAMRRETGSPASSAFCDKDHDLKLRKWAFGFIFQVARKVQLYKI